MTARREAARFPRETNARILKTEEHSAWEHQRRCAPSWGL